jgi:predicted ATPase/transcriptional regulator with XRE-family HTH domain
MAQGQQPIAPAVATNRPRWSTLLRALREAQGVTQPGWAALLGVSETTVRRWERGAAAPTADVERALLAHCRERGLFRTFTHGPLRGLTLNPELLRDALAEARLSAGATGAAPPLASVPVSPAGEDPAAAGAVGPATARSSPPARTNLPVPLTSFVGRERELHEIAGLLESSRLLTLTGPGGVGKTRLALEVARSQLPHQPGGVWWVDLAPLTDPTQVLQTVGTALGVRPERGRPMSASLADALQAESVLLVLDNGEHVVAACAELVEALLRDCPGLRVLTTSRVALSITGEVRYPLAPLALPAEDVSAERLEQYAGVRLFVERARAVQPAFALTAATAAAVTRICRRLDGMPLALELAAARAATFTAQQLAARLERQEPMLTSGNRTAPLRQQTLEATLAWSYDLLTKAERVLFRRLAVFAGGFTLAAAEAVAADADLAVDQVAELLDHLVGQSLVLVEASGEEARYRLLETVRAYTWDKLAASGELTAVRARHEAWYGQRAAEAVAALAGPGRPAWLAWLGQEHDNLRAALTWAEDGGAVQAAARLKAAVQEAQRGRSRPHVRPGTAVWIARAMWAVSVALMALALANLPQARTLASFGSHGVDAVIMVALLAFPTVGALIITRRPGHRIGWLFCLAGLIWAQVSFAEEYGSYGLLQHPGSLPGARVAAWASVWIWVPGLHLALPLLFLLFPTGRLLSPRWRPVIWLAGVSTLATMINIAFSPGPLAELPGVMNPVAISGEEERLLGWLGHLGQGALQLTLIASVACLALRFRRARGDERHQLKWLLAAAALFCLSYGLLSSTITVAPQTTGYIFAPFGLALAGVPVAVGIAILKYRLYDIDLLINRALVYGALTVALALAYITAALGLGRLLRSIAGPAGTDLALVAGMLAVAALFQPTRRRIQGLIDRHFPRPEYPSAEA